MEPLIVLVVVTLSILIAGFAGIRRLRPWPVALRGGLAAMFLLTGSVHFVYMRTELINMVPPILPYPDLIVTTNVYLAINRLATSPEDALIPRTLMQILYCR